MADVTLPGRRKVVKVLMHIQVAAEDREAYGGEEWVTFDPEYVENLPAREIIALEQAAKAAGEPIHLLTLMPDEMEGVRVKAMLLLARKQAGLVDVWANFQPRLGKLRFRIEPIFAEPEPEHPDPLGDGSASSPTTPADAASPTG